MAKILIVEDEEVLLEVLKEKLEEDDYDVRIARDGEEAISVTKTFKPDLILLDLLLPKKSGFDVLRALRSDLDLKTLKVVVLSNLSDDQQVKEALSLGARDYFVKGQDPINQG